MISIFFDRYVNLGALLALVILSACSTKIEGESRLRVPLPNGDSDSSGKISSLGFTYNLGCYAVNVTGSGIISTAPKACEIPIGLFSNVAKPPTDSKTTQELIIDFVPRGTGHSLEMFVYQRATDSEVCPTPADFFAKKNLSKIIRIAKQSFDMNQSVVQVKVIIDPSASSTSIAAQYGLPRSCTAGPAPTAGSAGVGSAHARLTGGGLLMQVSVGGGPKEQRLQGGNLTMQLGRKAQQ